jgi:hypothetical protein
MNPADTDRGNDLSTRENINATILSRQLTTMTCDLFATTAR